METGRAWVVNMHKSEKAKLTINKLVYKKYEIMKRQPHLCKRLIFFVELCTYRGPQRFGGKKDINDAAISKKCNTPEEKE